MVSGIPLVVFTDNDGKRRLGEASSIEISALTVSGQDVQGGAGATTLSGLSDVSAAPTVGQSLTWNGAIWVGSATSDSSPDDHNDLGLTGTRTHALLEDQIDFLSSTADATNADVTALTSDVTGNTTTITNLTSDVTGNTTNIAGLTSDVTGNTTNIANLSSVIDSNSADIVTVSGDVTALNIDVTSLETRFGSHIASSDVHFFTSVLTDYLPTSGGSVGPLETSTIDTTGNVAVLGNIDVTGGIRGTTVRGNLHANDSAITNVADPENDTDAVSKNWLDTVVAAINLSELVDVSSATPSDGDVLTFHNSLSEWIPSAVPTGGGSSDTFEVLHRDFTEVEVSGDSSTVIEVFSYTVPAGTWTASGILKVELGSRYKNNSGATRNSKINIKINGTNVWADAWTNTAGTGEVPIFINLTLMNAGSTTSQKLFGSIEKSRSGNSAATGYGDANSAPNKLHNPVMGEPTAINTGTTALTLSVEYQHQTTSTAADPFFTKHYALVEGIN